MTFVTGQRLTADLLQRAVPRMFYSEATSALTAGLTTTAVPGISIAFTTTTTGATLTTWWTMRADPTAATTAQISCRPSVAGPSAFLSAATNYAVAAWNAGAGGDVLTIGNSNIMTLGNAGSYTVTLLGTTGTNEQIGLYSSLTAMVQEVI